MQEDVRSMIHSELAIEDFYDHEQHDRRRAPDWGGDDLFAGPAPRRFSRAHPIRLRETTEHPLPPAAAPEREPEPDRYLAPVPVGRRTVTITGRPEGTAIARRPSRTMDERIAHRPERLMSWACALGFLLIAIAVITAH
jgi:hypothetical protein